MEQAYQKTRHGGSRPVRHNRSPKRTADSCLRHRRSSFAWGNMRRKQPPGSEPICVMLRNLRMSPRPSEPDCL